MRKTVFSTGLTDQEMDVLCNCWLFRTMLFNVIIVSFTIELC